MSRRQVLRSFKEKLSVEKPSDNKKTAKTRQVDISDYAAFFMSKFSRKSKDDITISSMSGTNRLQGANNQYDHSELQKRIGGNRNPLKSIPQAKVRKEESESE